MLVLTRKVGQEIVLPDLGVTITVVKVQGGKLRIGINAPAGVTILRGELLPETPESEPTTV